MSEPRLLLGDCVERLRDLDDASVDAIATDPPYGLGKEPPIADVLEAWLAGRVYVPTGGGFMGKTWDAFVPDLAVWRECFRVLKPGGYLLSFSGTRTVELIAIGLRLAGFERRDLIAWMYGSGFPKSLDVSKAIDKAAGAEREVIGVDAGKAQRGAAPSSRYEKDDERGWERPNGRYNVFSQTGEITAPATEDARTWQGWGTALKPALEPIVVARKPLAGTVIANVLEHGTGALNIAATRVAFQSADDERESKEKNRHGDFGTEQGGNAVYGDFSMLDPRANYDAPGRWPANVLLTHTDECVRVGERQVTADGHWPAARPGGSELAGATGHVGQDDLVEREASGETVAVWECSPDCPVHLLDAQSGVSTSTAHQRGEMGRFDPADDLAKRSKSYTISVRGPSDVGGASRFFYTAKTSRAERNAGLGDDRNDHPTVKPVELMRWLVRLVARPGSVVCDPFLGSGTTGIACGLEGVDFVGIEREPEYLAIAEARMRFWAEHGDEALRIVADRDAADRVRKTREDAGQLDLFA